MIAGDRLRDLILSSLRDDRAREAFETYGRLGPKDSRALIALAKQLRVRPMLYARMKARGLEGALASDAWREMERVHQRTVVRTLQFNQALQALGDALRSKGIEVIVLKGLHLANAVYDAIGQRWMNDIDVLVRRERLAEAVETALEAGYQPLSAMDVESEASAGHPHVTRLANNTGVHLEMHWTLTPASMPSPLDLDGIWRRAKTLRIGGALVLGLADEDLLLHLCGHAARQHLFDMGLQPLCDVTAVARRSRLDWHAVADRATAWRWRRGVDLALRLAAELMDAPVPRPLFPPVSDATADDEVYAIARGRALSGARGSPSPVSHVDWPLLDSSPVGDKLRYLGSRLAPRALPADAGWPTRARASMAQALRLTRHHAARVARLWMSTRSPIAGASADREEMRRTARLHQWLREDAGTTGTPGTA
jgi:hypothetical protein